MKDIEIGDILWREMGSSITRRLVLAVLIIDDIEYVVTRYIHMRSTRAKSFYLTNKPRIDAVKYLKTLDYKKEKK